MNLPLPVRRDAAAFTLIELVVVISVTAALFALVMGSFISISKQSKRRATEMTVSVTASALRAYQEETGQYPEPASPGETTEVAGKTYEVAGAATLYQALSGDGDDQMVTADTGTARPSNGSLDDEEVKLVFLKEMPRTMWVKQDGKYFMADGWGRPIQYLKAVDEDPARPNPGPAPTTINTTFDLWSYGDDIENTMARSVDVLKNAELKKDSRRWIFNW